MNRKIKKKNKSVYQRHSSILMFIVVYYTDTNMLMLAYVPINGTIEKENVYIYNRLLAINRNKEYYFR